LGVTYSAILLPLISLVAAAPTMIGIYDLINDARCTRFSGFSELQRQQIWSVFCPRRRLPQWFAAKKLNPYGQQSLRQNRVSLEDYFLLGADSDPHTCIYISMVNNRRPIAKWRSSNIEHFKNIGA
jgi:hypothetical protein